MHYNNSSQDNIIKKKRSVNFFIFTQEEREKIRDIRNEKKSKVI